MSKPTPGPWCYSYAGRNPSEIFRIWSSALTTESGIARVFAWPSRDEEAKANARLIAAAPDLLAACLAMRVTMYSPDSEPSRLADAAIAKATL